MVSLSAVRAISAVVATRIIRLAGWVLLGIASLACIAIVLLGIYVNPWWYLLFVLFVPLGLIGLVVFLVARFLVRRMYPAKLSKAHKQQILSFSNNVVMFARSHAMPLPMLGTMLVKDVVTHRNLDSLQELFSESSSLYKEYTDLVAKLEKAEAAPNGAGDTA